MFLKYLMINVSFMVCNRFHEIWLEHFAKTPIKYFLKIFHERNISFYLGCDFIFTRMLLRLILDVLGQSKRILTGKKIIVLPIETYEYIFILNSLWNNNFKMTVLFYIMKKKFIRNGYEYTKHYNPIDKCEINSAINISVVYVILSHNTKFSVHVHLFFF